MDNSAYFSQKLFTALLLTGLFAYQLFCTPILYIERNSKIQKEQY